MRRPVTIARYLDVTAAQLAKLRLGGEGIEAFVIEATGFNPLLTGAAGGVQLQVRERDLDRAREILADVPAEVEDDVDPYLGGERVVRCPRCELEYCFHERGSVARGDTAVRWRCRKCEHVWDDPNAGPLKMTRTEPGDPRPVFRLGRRQAGMGLFLGLMVGFFGAMVIGSGGLGRDLRNGGVSLGFFAVATIFGWLLGRSARRDVCSEPSCRAELPKEVDECPSCKGTIAGKIKSAPEHFSAAADVRREVAASRAEAPTLARKKKKKPVEPSAPAP